MHAVSTYKLILTTISGYYYFLVSGWPQVKVKGSFVMLLLTICETSVNPETNNFAFNITAVMLYLVCYNKAFSY